MQNHLNTKLIFILGLMIGFGIKAARATELPAVSHCGVLEAIEGDIELLDAAKQNLIEPKPKAILGCGTWISARQGWAKIKYRDGAVVSLGSYTLVQIVRNENSLKSKSPSVQKDQVTLIKGEIFVQNDDNGAEFRVATASGRVRIKNGKAIVIFDSDKDLSQLISLSETATLENRFEPGHKILVQAGESSDLDLTLKRVIPSMPKAVSVSSLYPRFLDLQILGREQSQAIEAVLARQKKMFAADLLDDGGNSLAQHSLKNSHQNESPKALAAKRAIANEQEKIQIQKKFEKKIVADAPVGPEAFHPDPYEGDPNTARVLIEDPSEHIPARMKKREETEKKRLMHELSNLQVK